MNPSQPTKLNKGDRVECVLKGQPLYGAILKGGNGKVTMVADGGKQSLSGPVSCFKLSTHPLPVDPITSEADRWSVTDFQPFHGRDDCVAYEATLCCDGQPFLRVFNNGLGDGDKISPLGDKSLMDIARFHAAGKAWGAANSAPANLYGFSHLWIVWYIEKRPFGITSADFLKETASRQK